MKWNNHHVSDIKMAYVGGGPKAWVWKLIADLALEPVPDGTVQLYDIDARAAEESQIIGSQFEEGKEAAGRWDYKATYSSKEALKGADFMVVSILPGIFEGVHSDIHLPERLGTYQSVGDTAGPSGMVRVLRILPMYEGIVPTIREFYPFAWAINCINLMGLCVASPYKTFPEIKVFGCYHEVFGMQKVLVAIASQELGTGPTDRKDICVNVLGVNHFTWLDTTPYEDVDLFPVYKKYIGAHFEEGCDDPDCP